MKEKASEVKTEVKESVNEIKEDVKEEIEEKLNWLQKFLKWVGYTNFISSRVFCN